VPGATVAEVLEGRTRVFVEDGPSEPYDVAANLPDGLELHTFFVLTPPPYLEAVVSGRSTLVANFPGRGLRAVPADRFVYPGRSFYGVVQAVAANADHLEAALVRVSPPDADGWCSFGVLASYLPELVSLGIPLLAEIDVNMPVVAGASRVALDRLTVLAGSSRPLAELVLRPPVAADRRIAELVTSVVPSEPVLQFGIGAIPDAVCEALAGRHGLRVRSGMVSDAVRALEDGLARGGPPPVEAALLAGSRDLYRWAADSSLVGLVPSAVLHDPDAIATIDRMVAVNSALEIDLVGNVNTEWSGGVAIGGRGGHPDFSAGAHRAVDGVSVVALPARRPDGRPTVLASIAPHDVSTGGEDVDVVVTEWGIADLRGHDEHDERARRIVAVAHPDDRAELLAAWP
jgi:4-hydroxybutyrate CoA-transferase